MKRLLIFCLCVPAFGAWKLETVATDLRYPVFAGVAPGETALYVVEQEGRIWKIDKSGRTVFLDIRREVNSGGEKGLLGLAFHPKFATNGRYFINYTATKRGLKTRVEERVRGRGVHREILSFPQLFANHNGGHLEFGKDGMLYIGVGDGGGAGDTQEMGQNKNEWLGTILRVDVDGSRPYGIPKGNPFTDKQGKPEIWAWGLRNPWRFSFDSKTGALLVGDVGQNKWEEINVITKGGNYGWNKMEGKHCYPPSSSCSPKQFIGPIWEYGREEGISVTGGYVYRGKMASLQGKYLYGDYQSGKIWALDWDKSKKTNTLILDTALLISSFGLDAQGELLVVDHGGKLLRLVQK